ncbi:uncharacterized protein LOC112538663 isoform X1 [Tetranychus urticae]|uniref:uncharacterized protein LOC112538663 isoform X1 n=1 Tax=Tetranychus urticae TaxID=32264 RepID=UPI000D656661|nr:uncharacterized protein LOC112538663 isoform X1 [Tetranychus urticae]
MNENENNNNTSDKITIKVRHSDENYHEITIDWANESFDYRKQLFHQLSAFTGIPFKYQAYVFVKANERISFDLHNIEFYDELSLPDDKELAMEQIQDGACYFFKTYLGLFYPNLASIFCFYQLIHRDLVNENDCNFYYCHSLGSRFFTKKFSEIIKSEHLQTFLDRRREGQTWETLTRIKLNLNIEHLTGLICRRYFESFGQFEFRFSDYYLRYRG